MSSSFGYGQVQSFWNPGFESKNRIEPPRTMGYSDGAGSTGVSAQSENPIGSLMERWPTNLSPEAVAEWVGQHFDATLMEHLKMQVIEVSKERPVLEMPVHPGIIMPSGHVHAGSMISLADTAATFAAMVASGRELKLEQIPVAISISSQIVANVQEGTIRAESMVTHPGRTLVTVATQVTADGGKLLALVSSTHFIRPSD